MPLLGFPEQRLDPHRPLAHGLGVGFRAVVFTDLLPILLIERPVELPPLTAISALGADRARLTRFRRRLVDSDPADIVVAPQAEHRPLRATIDILRRIVGEVALAEEGAILPPIWERHIGANPARRQPLEILAGAIGRVAHDPFGSHLPAKADPPHE